MPSQLAASIFCAMRALPRADATVVVHSCMMFLPSGTTFAFEHSPVSRVGLAMSYTFGMQEPDLTLVREFRRRAENALPGRVVRVMLPAATHDRTRTGMSLSF